MYPGWNALQEMMKKQRESQQKLAKKYGAGKKSGFEASAAAMLEQFEGLEDGDDDSMGG